MRSWVLRDKRPRALRGDEVMGRLSRWVVIATCCGSVLLLHTVGTVRAETAESSNTERTSDQFEGSLPPDTRSRLAPPTQAKAAPANSKLDAPLDQIVRTAQIGQDARRQALRASGLPDTGDRIVVVIEAENTASARSAAILAGATVQSEFQDLIQIELPISSIEQLANAPGVRRIRLPMYGFPEAVSSEGVRWTGADVWQQAERTGSGARVAVLDGGFAGYQTRQTQGDLPASLTVMSFTANGDITGGGTNHGTVAAEIVYDMAPSAQLFLVNFKTEVELGNAVTWIVSQGIHVVNMSVGYPVIAGRGDGTGYFANIINYANANGVFWVQAAGNQAESRWGGNYRNTTGDSFHEWSGTDFANGALLIAGQQTCVYLRWDSWPVTSQDFDIYLLNSSGQIVAGSAHLQNGSQQPIENFCYTSSTTSPYYVVVQRYSGIASPRLDLELFNVAAMQFSVAAGSISIPGDAANAFTVGAINVASVDSTIEPFSAQGPTVDGRVKPDIAGPDGVTTGSLGPQGATGTSFSAPHVAGAAALIKGANLSATPAQIRFSLEAWASDRGTAGKDNLYGAGRMCLGTISTSAPIPVAPLQVQLLSQPVRLVDTRATSGLQGAGQPMIGYGCARRYVIAGFGGVPGDAFGIIANVTTVNNVSSAHLTVWPSGQPMPPTSNMNFAPIEPAIANMAVIRLGAGGQIDVVGALGVDVLIDVVGYIASPVAGTSRLNLLPQPQRLADTRPGSGFQGAGQALLGFATPTCFQVAGQAGVPADAQGILANIGTSSHPSAAYLTAWPSGQPLPVASNLNYAPFQSAIANMAVVRIGTDGKLCVVGAAGVNVLIDIVGYLSVSTGAQVNLFSQPQRLVDTRPNSGYQGAGAPMIGFFTAREYLVASQVGVPADATGILANVTTFNHPSTAHLTIWPSGQSLPTTSNLNYAVEEPAIANMAIIRIGDGGKVSVIGAPGLNAIIDVVGFIR
jgi:hypothetical protein